MTNEGKSTPAADASGVPYAGADSSRFRSSGVAAGEDQATFDDGAAVVVLMGTYNGEAHIEEQLRSIAEQTYRNWRLVVSDDGSTDRTLEIIAAFAAGRPEGQVTVVGGPGVTGHGRKPGRDTRELATVNFLSLLTQGAITGDYFALADQDDVWSPSKLSRAMAWLVSLPQGEPALYCARTELIGESGRPAGLSPLFKKPPSFRNALVQSIAGGNTMVLNRPARDLVAAFGMADVVAHDWWLYLLLSGCGAHIRYDPVTSVGYRQHGANLVGSNRGLAALVARGQIFAGGVWADWTDRHVAALQPALHLLTPENRLLLERLVDFRQEALMSRIRILSDLGLYRQTLVGQITMAAAVLTGRL